MSIRELLESTNEDSKDVSKHAMSRIVYGACLALSLIHIYTASPSATESAKEFL